jgi:hypothetical protein
VQLVLQVRPRPCGVSDFQRGQRRNADETPRNSLEPVVSNWTAGEPDESRLVDQPDCRAHSQARLMSSSSARPLNRSPNRSKSARVTQPTPRRASCASRRRRYSFRDSPSLAAWASNRATSSGSRSRMSTSVVSRLLISLDSRSTRHPGAALQAPQRCCCYATWNDRFARPIWKSSITTFGGAVGSVAAPNVTKMGV